MKKAMPTPLPDSLPGLLSPAVRRLHGAMVISGLLAILAGAISVPFFFESSSMLYKFGVDKTLLRSGKVLGMMAACLVILQSVLSARIKFLDRIFAVNNLMNAHRACGLLIAGCAMIHPVLIFIPEDMTTIPFSFRYWPEFVGVFLLIMISGMVIVALFRLKLGISFDRWRTMHRWGAFLAAIALFVHVLSVSETFEKGVPRTVVFCAIGFYILLFAWVKCKPFMLRKNPFSISSAAPIAKDAFQVTIVPETGKAFSYLPGQFGFICVKSENISPEAHPFTIASSPSRPDNLEFIIRTCGDWTRKIGGIKQQDPVYVDGPFGLFTHLRCSQNKAIIMIAGGIGITPMLSMLRFMADAKDSRDLTLIWSNRTRDHIVLADEFDLLEKNLAGLRIIHVITDHPPGNKTNHKPDQPGLEKLLAACSRQSAVFVCGPPQMMTETAKALVRLGFLRKNIFTERFSL